jgi:hypothetical protein
MFDIKEAKQHLLLNSQIAPYLYVYVFNVNNPGNKTSVTFSGSAVLAPEWAVRALQAASTLPW